MISRLKENPVQVRFPNYGFGSRAPSLQHNKQIENSLPPKSSRAQRHVIYCNDTASWCIPYFTSCDPQSEDLFHPNSTRRHHQPHSLTVPVRLSYKNVPTLGTPRVPLPYPGLLHRPCTSMPGTRCLAFSHPTPNKISAPILFSSLCVKDARGLRVCFAFAIPEEFVVIDSWMDRCWWLGRLITAAEQRQSPVLYDFVHYLNCETPKARI